MRLDCRHSRRSSRAQRRFRRRRRQRGMGRRAGRPGTQGEHGNRTSTLPGNADLFERMRAAKTTDTVIADWGDAEKAFGQAAHFASATYRCPYQSHAPFAAELCACRCRPERRAWSSPPPRTSTIRAPCSRRSRTAGRQGTCAVFRGLGHVRAQLLRGCRPSGGGDVAGGRQSRCACSSCAGTSTVGTITAPRIWPTCARASMRPASSSPTSITAGSTAGWSTRPPTNWRS